MKADTQQHTPGPWTLQDDEDRECLDVCIPKRPGVVRMIASVYYGYTDEIEAQQKANAVLMASSPDLLAALQTMVGFFEGGYPRQFDIGADHPLNLARAAIAKAEGRAPVSQTEVTPR